MFIKFCGKHTIRSLIWNRNTDTNILFIAPATYVWWCFYVSVCARFRLHLRLKESGYTMLKERGCQIKKQWGFKFLAKKDCTKNPNIIIFHNLQISYHWINVMAMAATQNVAKGKRKHEEIWWHNKNRDPTIITKTSLSHITFLQI